MSKTGKIGVLLLVLVLVGASIWYGVAQRSGLESAMASPSVADPPDLSTGEPSARSDLGPALQPALEDTQIADYSAAFRKAANYRQFISDALAAARGGNADAQYYVSAAMKYCASMHGFLKRRGKVVPLEEVIKTWESVGDYRTIEAVRRAEGRCREIWDKPDASWGSADEWLAKATESGQAVAQAIMAQQLTEQKYRAGQQKMPDLDPDRPESWVSYRLTDEDLEEPRALVSAALLSRNPEAMLHIGELAWRLTPDRTDTEADHQSWVWLYAACLRGLDCSAEAEWHKNFCSVDPGCSLEQDGMEYLLQIAPQLNLMNLEARAYAINDKIDQGHWKALGLGL